MQKVPTLFVSHRHEDAFLAKRIRDKLEKISQRKIQVFISEDIGGGKKWRENILDALDASDYLFLIYSDGGEDWSWCFYEVGYFYARVASNIDGKILCFRAEGVPVPSPIGHLQQPSTKEKIATCLVDLLATVGVSAKAEAAELATEIAKGVASRGLEGIKRVVLEFSRKEAINEYQLPHDTMIVADPAPVRAT